MGAGRGRAASSQAGFAPGRLLATSSGSQSFSIPGTCGPHGSAPPSSAHRASARRFIRSALGFFSAMAWLLFKVLPQEFAPTEDRGTFFITVNAPEGASMEFTDR